MRILSLCAPWATPCPAHVDSRLLNPSPHPALCYIRHLTPSAAIASRYPDIQADQLPHHLPHVHKKPHARLPRPSSVPSQSTIPRPCAHASLATCKHRLIAQWLLNVRLVNSSTRRPVSRNRSQPTTLATANRGPAQGRPAYDQGTVPVPEHSVTDITASRTCSDSEYFRRFPVHM